MAYKDPEKRRKYLRAWRAKNREKCIESNRKYRAANKDIINQRANERYHDNPEKQRANSRKYLNSHPKVREKARERTRSWRAKNRDWCSEYSRKWNHANPEKARERDRAQYAAERAHELEMQLFRFAMNHRERRLKNG